MMKFLRSTKFLFWAVAVLAGIAPALAQGQGATVSGRVMSEQGQPLSSANVYINDLNISVGTNQNGQFTINIPQARLSGQTVNIRVRAIGYQPQLRAITLTAGAQTVNFDLRRDVTQLGEIVVTGVASATETVKLPFTVSRIDSAMMPVSGSNPLTQLQGKVPGAMIVNASGRPGAAPTVLLRGPVSLNATGRTQQPLYLLDGIPLQGTLPDINPEDIENVEVVKGAAAASLYGARAGAGVINITTKTGKNAAQGIRLSARTEGGTSDIEGRFPLNQFSNLLLDPSGTRFCSREVLQTNGQPVGTSAGQNAGVFSSCARYITWDDEVQRINNSGVDFSLPPQNFMGDFGISNTPSYDHLTGTYQASVWPIMRDPVKQSVTPSAYANSTIDLRGKLSNTGVYASVSNFVQQGAVRFLPGFVRNSARVNIDQRFGDKISGSLNTFYAQTVDHASQFDETSGLAGTWFNLTRAPFISDLLAKDNQGRLVVRHNPLFQGEQNFNPMYSTAYNSRTDRGNRFVGGMTAKYAPLGWLTVDGTFGYDRATGEYLQQRDRGWRVTASAPATSSGFIGEGSYDNEQWNTSFSASAQHTFFSDFNATLSGRYVYSDLNIRNTTLSGIGLALPGLITADAATTNLTIGSGRQAIRDMGFFYGADFDWKDRYIFGGLVRRDGSSLFGPENRWQTFGRISGAWIASREPWWPAPNAISLLKLRASRGSTGQRPRFDAQYETFTIGTGGTLNPAFLGNKKLKPEVNTEVEIGTDLEFFHRVGINVSYARAVIDDQILPVPLPTATGFSRQWQNAGEITNKTWEATVTVPIVQRTGFNWTSRFIWDQTRSYISRLDIPEFVGTITPQGGNNFDIFKFRQGERIGTVYGNDMVRNCSQLPGAFASQCSMSSSDVASAFRPNSDGFIVWVGAGNQLTEGITKNLWRSRLEQGQGPWGNRTNWGMPITLRDSTNNIAFVPLGNGLPKFHWGLSQNFDYKRLSLYGLLDASIGQKMWNVAYHWSIGDLQVEAADQFGKSVEEARPIGYFWRRGASASPGGSSGVGGLYDVLAVHGWSFEDASYVKLREVSATFRVGAIGGAGDWRIGVVGRNLKTWTDWRGFDPESGNTTGPLNSSILTPVAGYRFPNLRTYTFQLSSTF
jgi:TonB-linked SusC/RagA family outer membrane protein